MKKEFKTYPHTGGYLDGKYKIIAEIARGGMGIVYLAQDLVLNKKWAVKKITYSSAARQSGVPFEAEILKNLDHPGIVRLQETICDDEDIYMVMEYIPGVTLERVIREHGPESERQALLWAVQLCDVLKYLHTRAPAVIYGDMKPANIMVDPGGNIKLIDFGSSGVFESYPEKEDVSFGTKGYAPPELYTGKADERSDIYSFGMTLYRMFTGRDPSKNKAFMPIHSLRPDISPRTAAVVEKCVRADPAGRYHSCREILRDLERIRVPRTPYGNRK